LQGGKLSEFTVFVRLLDRSLAVDGYQMGQSRDSLLKGFNVEVDHWRIGLQPVTKAQKQYSDNS
jgi:hypothetical protein